MKLKFTTVLMATLAALCLGAAPAALSQSNWPDRSVILVVPFTAGGPTDLVARLIMSRQGEARCIAP